MSIYKYKLHRNYFYLYTKEFFLFFYKKDFIKKKFDIASESAIGTYKLPLVLHNSDAGFGFLLNFFKQS